MNISEKITELINNQTTELTDEQVRDIDGSVLNAEELKDMLPDLKAGYDSFKEQENQCNTMQKNWAGMKKLWAARGEAIQAFVARAMSRFGLKTLEGEGAAVKSTTRTNIEADNDAILAPYLPAISALSRQLPEYVKLDVKVDKTKLNAFVKSNPKFLVDNPQAVYQKESTTYQLK